MTRIIHIYILQLLRILSACGLFRLIVLFFLLLIVGGGIYEVIVNKYPNNYYILSCIVLSTYTLNSQNKDAPLLKIIIPHYKIFYAIKSFFIISPILLIYAYSGQWSHCLILALSTFIIPQIGRIKLRSRTSHLFQRWIRPSEFEWVAGIREKGKIILVLWIVGIGGAFLLGVIPCVLLLISMLILSFNEKRESPAMLLALEMKPSRFMFYKIKYQIINYLIIALPLILIFMIFHYSYWYIPICIILISCSLICFSILVKYAFYAPKEGLITSQIWRSIGVILGIIFILLPFLWLISYFLYNRAIKHLTLYLNDFD